jgi:hypothetical protein
MKDPSMRQELHGRRMSLHGDNCEGSCPLRDAGGGRSRARQRKVMENELCFPTVHDQSRLERQPYSQLSRATINLLDPETEAIAALNECELIIENLKQLVNGKARQKML